MVAQSTLSGTEARQGRASALRWLIALGGPVLATLLATSASTDRDISIGLFSLAVLTAAVVGGPVMGVVALAVSVAAEATMVSDHPAEQDSRVLALITLLACGVAIVGLAYVLVLARRRTETEAARTRSLHELTTTLTAVDTDDNGLTRVAELARIAAGAKHVVLSIPCPLNPVDVSAGERVPPDGGERAGDPALVRHVRLPSASVPADEGDEHGGYLELTFGERPPSDRGFGQFLEAIAAQGAQAVERLALRRAEQRAQADDEFLGRATATLSASLNAEAVVAALRTLTVPYLADVCEVMLVIGQRAVVPPVPVPTAPDREWTAPLETRGRTVGWIHLVRHQRSFEQSDMSVAEALAQRASQAVENAILYEEQARASTTLQRSLLPQALLPAPNLHLAARYVPATERHEVGGDFYDAMQGPDGSVVLIIGDVQGKGMEAATLTSVARHTLRTAALDGDGPKAMLLRLNQALLYAQHEQRAATADVDDEAIRFVSAAVVVLTPVASGFRATTACAGHPSPMHVRPEGTVAPMASNGTVLGVVEDAEVEIEERIIDLRFADTVVLVTDGVTEQYDGTNFFDETDLRRLVVNRTGPVDAEAIAELIEETALLFAAGHPRDDIAILVACVTGPR